MNNNETLKNQGAVNSAPKEYYEPVSSIDLKEQKVSKKSKKRPSKKSSDKNPVLSKREIELMKQEDKPLFKNGKDNLVKTGCESSYDKLSENETDCSSD